MNKLSIRKNVLPYLVGGVVVYMSMFSTIPRKSYSDELFYPVIETFNKRDLVGGKLLYMPLIGTFPGKSFCDTSSYPTAETLEESNSAKEKKKKQ